MHGNNDKKPLGQRWRTALITTFLSGANHLPAEVRLAAEAALKIARRANDYTEEPDEETEGPVYIEAFQQFTGNDLAKLCALLALGEELFRELKRTVDAILIRRLAGQDPGFPTPDTIADWSVRTRIAVLESIRQQAKEVEGRAAAPNIGITMIPLPSHIFPGSASPPKPEFSH
jgi:hypothetical protein